MNNGKDKESMGKRERTEGKIKLPEKRGARVRPFKAAVPGLRQERRLFGGVCADLGMYQAGRGAVMFPIPGVLAADPVGIGDKNGNYAENTQEHGIPKIGDHGDGSGRDPIGSRQGTGQQSLAAVRDDSLYHAGEQDPAGRRYARGSILYWALTSLRWGWRR